MAGAQGHGRYRGGSIYCIPMNQTVPANGTSTSGMGCSPLVMFQCIGIWRGVAVLVILLEVVFYMHQGCREGTKSYSYALDLLSGIGGLGT